jgi:hypothetical protein
MPVVRSLPGICSGTYQVLEGRRGMWNDVPGFSDFTCSHRDGPQLTPVRKGKQAEPGK